MHFYLSSIGRYRSSIEIPSGISRPGYVMRNMGYRSGFPGALTYARNRSNFSPSVSGPEYAAAIAGISMMRMLCTSASLPGHPSNLSASIISCMPLMRA